MAKKKTNYNAFVTAMKMHGGVRHYDLGGTVARITPYIDPGIGSITSGVINAINNPGTPTVQGGLAGTFTPQSVYTAQQAPIATTNYAPAMGTGLGLVTSGANQAQGNIAAEQALASQYGNIAAGQGPNPALSQLAQTTGTNVANQNALMAGARGAGSNAGLIAREAAQQGASTQQQAAGQAATLAAQQELGAMGQQAGLQGQIGSQIQGQQGVGGNLYGTATGAQNAQNQAIIQNTMMPQEINAQTAANNAQQVNSRLTQLTGGAMSGLSALASIFAKGGEVPSAQDMPLSPGTANYDKGGPISFAGRYLQGMGSPGMAKGGKVPAMVSPGEKYLPPSAVDKVKKGAKPSKVAEHIPGKAKVKGDNLKNDTVAKTLESGGIVIPRTKANDDDKARKFVHAVLAKGGRR